MTAAPWHDRPPMSLIEAVIPRYGVGLYVGGMEAAATSRFSPGTA